VTSVVLGGSVAGVPLLAGLEFLDLDFTLDGGVRVYFVDMRVYIRVRIRTVKLVVVNRGIESYTRL
jgi:hypothetical protein